MLDQKERKTERKEFDERTSAREREAGEEE